MTAEQVLFLKVQNACDVAARGQSDLGHDVLGRQMPGKSSNEA
jgi:hypothetical protein